MQKIVIALGPHGGGRTDHLIYVDIPNEYEFTGEFRRAKKGDYCFINGCVIYWEYGCPGLSDTLILRKLTPAAPPTQVTVKDIYGTDNPKIPNGYKATGEFRVVNEKDEFWLSMTGNATQYHNDRVVKAIRLILKAVV